MEKLTLFDNIPHKGKTSNSVHFCFVCSTLFSALPFFQECQTLKKKGPEFTAEGRPHVFSVASVKTFASALTPNPLFRNKSMRRQQHHCFMGVHRCNNEVRYDHRWHLPEARAESVRMER